MRKFYWEEWVDGSMVGLLITGSARGSFEERMDPEFTGGEPVEKYVIEFSFAFPNGEKERVTATREGEFTASVDRNYFYVPRSIVTRQSLAEYEEAKDEFLAQAEAQAEAIFQKIMAQRAKR